MTETLFNLFADSAARYPDAEALVHGKRRVSYRELFEKSCKAASFLLSNGLKSGDRVALLMENSPEYVASYYGALAAGGVAVGLNTAARARDLQNWLSHCGASWLIAEAKHRELPAVFNGLNGSTRVLTVGSPDTASASVGGDTWEKVEAVDNVSPPAIDQTVQQPDQPAAIIYTSGTTGTPKGVCLSHRNLYANTRSILEYLQLEHSDRIVNILPFTYSYGNSILHTHLAVGGTVILENSFVFPKKIVEKMAQERSTGISGVPSSFALLLARTNMAEYDLSSLRYLTQAGGPMPPANQKRLKALLPNVKIFIMYGQTEATARLTWLPPERLEEKLGACGIPIPGVEIEIRNEDGIPLAPHETGEIYARGQNIMLGYWNAPELTKEVIRDGWLKTGDLAHFDDDGFIFIDGRSAEMIKSRGQRISPIEVEDVIAELDGIAEVGVAGVEDELLGQTIKAVVVLKSGATVDEKHIKRHCLKALPPYKVPKTIEFAESLPKTGSGKVRRHLL